VSTGPVVLVSPADPRWDAYVTAHPDATLFHLAGWSQMLRDAYRFVPVGLAVAGADGRLHGLLPLAAKRGRVTGARLLSLPAAPTGGPLADGDDEAVALLTAARDLAAARGLALSIATRRRGLAGAVPGLVELPTREGPSWVLPLPAAGEADSWLRTRAKDIRYGVRRAHKAGVRVRFSDRAEDLRAIHAVYLHAMRKHRALPRSLAEWRTAQARLAGAGATITASLAERDGRVASSGLLLSWRDTVVALYGANDPALRADRPNHARVHAIAAWAAERGLTRLDLARAVTPGPLADFKRAWGAEPVPEAHIAQGDADAGPSSGTDETATNGRIARSLGPLWTLVERGWDRAPDEALRAGGHIAYRYL